jgi:hypothetical protein
LLLLNEELLMPIYSNSQLNFFALKFGFTLEQCCTLAIFIIKS